MMSTEKDLGEYKVTVAARRVTEINSAVTVTATVRFYSLWRRYLGREQVPLEANNMEEALAQIEDRFGSCLREQLEADGIQLEGKIQDYSLILLNGISLHALKRSSLREGDVLQIPPATGG